MKAQLMHLPGSQHASPLQLWSRASTVLCDRVRDVDAAVGDDHYVTGMRAACAWLLVAASMTERISGTCRMLRYGFGGSRSKRGYQSTVKAVAPAAAETRAAICYLTLPARVDR